MTIQNIEEKLIRGISAIISKEESSIAPEQPFHNLGVDSLGFVEVLVFIEKTFGLRLIELNLAKQDFETIHSIASFIHAKL